MTNESKYINPELDCKGCGKCCESFEMSFPNLPRAELTEEDLLNRSVMDRLEMLSIVGCQISRRDEGTTTWLIFHIPCKYLLSDKSCEIYDNPIRPLLCRRFPYSDTTRESCPKVHQKIVSIRPLDVFK